MKTRIKIKEIFSVANEKTIFVVEVENGKYLIGDVFKNEENSLEFELLGVGMENSPLENPSKSFLVKKMGDYDTLKDFEDGYFEKVEPEI